MAVTAFYDDDRPAPLHTHEGLTRYCSEKRTAPVELTRAEYDALTPARRKEHNRCRLLHLSGGIFVSTKAAVRAKASVRRLMSENLGRNSGHTGLMISGDSTLGKTTIAKELLKYVFRTYGKQFPDFAKHGRIPAVYIEVPAGCTGKLLMIAFAEFFELGVARNETADSIRRRVVKALNAARTQLIIVDELHNLTASNRGNGESIDILKSLHNQVAATFVYSGINLQTNALLSGDRGQQLSARFTRFDMPRFNLSDPDQVHEWRGIVNAFDTALPLMEHEKGSLLKLSTYLHQRTGGSIGSLGRLITSAALELIINPDGRPETITKELLDDQRIDETAETSYAKRINSAKSKAKTAA